MSDWQAPGSDKHAMVKAFGDLRYRQVNCGFKHEDHHDLIYVRYKPTAQQSFGEPSRILSAGNEYVHFDFPDREILFTRSNLAVDGDRPFNQPQYGKAWDTAVSLSPILSSGDDLPYDRIMINPHAYPSRRYEPRLRDPTCCYTSDKLVMIDSGAFQLGHGAFDFIHPKTLAAFYRRNGDEGVTLDLPARAIADEEILKHTARIQNLNTRYLKRLLPKEFRLATVFHGQKLAYLDRFRRDIEEYDDDFSLVCIPGTQRLNLLEALHKTLHIIANGKQYAQYHLLGVSNPPLVVALIRMAYLFKRSGRDVLLTSDSSSPIGFSLKHTYYGQPAFYHGLTPTRYGQRLSSSQDAPAGKVPNPHNRFAVNDPLSQIIGGYQDVISTFNIHITRTYIMYVNQIELVRYINQMCLFSDTLDAKQYKELVLYQYRGSKHAHILGKALDYLEDVFESGIDKAFQRYRSYMPYFTGEATLHKFPAMGEDNEETEEHDSSIKRKRLVRVIKNYYEFHKTGAVPNAARVKKDGTHKNTTLQLKL